VKYFEQIVWSLKIHIKTLATIRGLLDIGSIHIIPNTLTCSLQTPLNVVMKAVSFPYI
jgi:hypothetical protein